MNSVYITRLSKFLPNEPVSNEEMEERLGMVNGKPSRARALVLRNNGIKTRYYAFRNGTPTHTSAGMAATAIRSLFDDKITLDSLELLTSGTTSPEQILPSHTSMIHGELGGRAMEIICASGACCSSIQAMKYAYLAVACGTVQTAVACGSERCSSWLQASRFQPEADVWEEMEKNPFLAFEKDFLRWMLSDGAGAALLQDKPLEDELSLKIEWIEINSFANELETCMYAGAIKNNDGSITGFNDIPMEEIIGKSVISFKQDTRLLGENIVPKGGEFLMRLMKKYSLTADDVDYFLPHLSSMFFKNQVSQYQKKIGIDIPEERWFYNLPDVGNVGAASPYLMLEELMYSGRLKKGDKILVMVPESARFTYAYLYLTVD